MFWGLIMEPQRRYTQAVKKPFHISMAALDESSSDNSPTQVICSFDQRNYLLCTLKAGQTAQVALDLNFEVGDKVSFATNGRAHVHLTGYLTTDEYFQGVEDEEEEEDDEISPDVKVEVKEEVTTKKKRQKVESSNSPPKKKSKTLELLEAVKSDDEDDDDDSDVNMSDLLEYEFDTTGLEEEEEDDEEMDLLEEEEESDDDDDEEIEGEEFDDFSSSSMSEEEEMKKPEQVLENGLANRKRRTTNGQQESPKPELRKREKGDKTPAKVDKTPAKGDKTPAKADKTPAKSDKSPVKGDNKSPPKTAKGDKTPGKAEKSPKKGEKTPANKTPKANAESPQKKVIEGGVIVQELKLGNGPVAKPGKFVKVYYEGKFKTNNKMFDSTTKGPGFEFRLGRQEVIKGWDVGVSGMKVGGKRRIVCPPNMAYGQKGSPPTIPSNSTLVFDVELINVK